MSIAPSVVPALPAPPCTPHRIPSPAQLPARVLHRVASPTPRRVRLAVGAHLLAGGGYAIRVVIADRDGHADLLSSATVSVPTRLDAFAALYETIFDLFPSLRCSSAGHLI